MSGDLLRTKEDGTLDLSYSAEQIKAFKEDPRNMLEHRIALEKDVSARCEGMIIWDPFSKQWILLLTNSAFSSRVSQMSSAAREASESRGCGNAEPSQQK